MPFVFPEGHTLHREHSCWAGPVSLLVLAPALHLWLTLPSLQI